MPASREWKSNLISSGLPLEFDAAKRLTSTNFTVEADYSYLRGEEGAVKECSVDIHASTYLLSGVFGKPPHETHEAVAVLRLLVECKQRLTHKKWLFLPVMEGARLSLTATRHIIRIVDEFVDFVIDREPITRFSSTLRMAFKGTEINLDKGDVYDNEMRHAMSQLQYAIPSLMCQNILLTEVMPHHLRAPFLFCPILLTTAELYITRDDVSASDIANANNIDDVAESVPYLCYSSTIGAEFQEHCSKRCARLATIPDKEWISALDAKARGTPGRHKASQIIQELRQGFGIHQEEYFRDIVVCTFTAFPELLKQLEVSIQSAVNGMRHL